ncbi:putative abortive infection protein [Gottschalkia purinilytica]|uniref:Putative abortive infection protein n=1 Tax=Gottschalkia purinilytica TaxID=1503 RepID=A0A0L0W7F5_GOTPU|nr:type II CAAX endopeptidase family protein [Gottschalkia purinilytica]KNF07463.1 putative abortive infection protein [Gottschalkia purinilytica]
MEKRKKVPSIIEANYMYFILGIMLLTLGGKAQQNNIYSGIFITEYLIILLPIMLYLVVRKYDLKSNLRLNKITLKQCFITILIMIFSYPVAIFFNYIVIVIMNIIGMEIAPSPLPISKTSSQFILGFLMFALSAGICEEVMFRGFIMKSYEKLGKWKAIVISGVLFGVFHFNIQNLFAPIFLGILLGYMVYKTNSIYTSIIGHTMNNSIALILTKIASSPDMPAQTNIDINGTFLIIGLLVIGAFALVSFLVVYSLLGALPETKRVLENVDSINSLSSFKYNSIDSDYLEGKIEKTNTSDKLLAAIPIVITILIYIGSHILVYMYK